MKQINEQNLTNTQQANDGKKLHFRWLHFSVLHLRNIQ